MNDASPETIRKFLKLFGLSHNFAPAELQSAYRTLAKLNHPDINRDAASRMRMVIVNKGYEVLRSFAASRENHSHPAEPAGDVYYTHYKNAFVILKSAFEDYFGEGQDKTKTGDRYVLIERLRAAKNGFSRLINEFPYNQWVDDAIDKISSINKWLD